MKKINPVIMIRYFTILSTLFISLTTLASELPVCESIIVQTSDKTIMENDTSFFKFAYEGPRIIKGDRGYGFLDDSSGYKDKFYSVSHSGDQTQLMGLDTNGAATIGSLTNILGLIFTPNSQIAKELSIDSIVVFCGTDKNKVLQKRADYAQSSFLIIKPFSDISK